MLTSVNHDKLDIIITTVRRTDLLVKTIHGLLSNLVDLHLLDRWIISDDGTPDAELDFLSAEFPFLEIHKNPDKGHANNLNYGHSLSDKRYILHFEDDWLMVHKVSLSHCLTFIKECNHTPVVTLPPKDTSFGRPVVEYPEMAAYVICNIDNEGGWPGFGLQPGVWDMWRMKEVGPFLSVGQFEKEFANRFRNKGFYVYKLEPMSTFEDGMWKRKRGPLVKHLGWNNTAYDKNKTRR